MSSLSRLAIRLWKCSANTSALLVGIYLNRALRADAVAEPNVASVLVNTYLHALLLAGPVLLATACRCHGVVTALTPGPQ